MNKTIRTLGLGLGILAGIAGAAPQASAQVTRQGNGYIFRYAFTKGMTISYNIDIRTNAPGMPQPMAMGMPVRMNVTDVKGEVATVRMSIGPMTMNGKAQGQGKAQTQTVQVNRRGQPVGGPAGGFAGTFPQGPIRVGQSWNSALPMSAAGMGNMTATYKLVGIRNQGGRQVAEISVSVAGQMKGSGSMFVNMADGQLQRSTLSMTMTMPAQKQGAAPQSMRMSMTMTRR